MRTAHIVFLGGGNMSLALAHGLLDSQGPKGLTIIERNPDRREVLTTQYGLHAVSEMSEVEHCDILILAVKPHQMAEAMQGIQEGVAASTLVISIALGWSIDDIAHFFHAEQPVVRAMPNTPAMLKAGATGLFANDHVSSAQKDQVEHIFRAVGITLWLSQEADIDAVTAISGSGPAYFFFMMECMYHEGLNMGLDEKAAQLLTVQTAFGAGRMALEQTDSLNVLREHVTSKGGATEAAISSMQSADLQGIVSEAMRAAKTRGGMLAEQWRQPKQIKQELGE